VNVVVCVVCTEAADLFRATVIAVIVTCTEALLLLSATDLAVSVTTAGVGTLAGAVYVIAAPDAPEVADSVPQAAPVQPAPLNVHVTPLFWESFATVAVTLVLCAVCTETAAGVISVTATVAGGGVSVDFTFAHPHAVKAISRNAAVDAKFVQKLRLCAKWRKFMYFYLPGQADSEVFKNVVWFPIQGHATRVSNCRWKQ
jgi:hypothetical protein